MKTTQSPLACAHGSITSQQGYTKVAHANTRAHWQHCCVGHFKCYMEHWAA